MCVCMVTLQGSEGPSWQTESIVYEVEGLSPGIPECARFRTG